MSRRLERFLFWVPRILVILFILFVSMFALDVFDLGYGFWQTILALLIHLVPTWLMLIVLLIAWRRELAGGILFILMGGFFLFQFWGNEFYTYLIFSLPLFITGILFIAHRQYQIREHPLS